VGWVVVTGLRVVHKVARPLVRTLWVALPSVLATVPPVLHCVVAATL
jgi:hypothetical protein